MKYVLDGEETERLKFRLLVLDDYEAWLPFFTDKLAYQYLAIKPNDDPDKLCRDWMDRNQRRYDNDEGGMNVLIDNKSGKMVGQCGLLVQDVLGTKRLEVGYSILPEYWNRGYATEAAVQCRDVAFKHQFAKELISLIHKDNDASKNVAIKNGMSLEQFLPSFRNKPVNVYKITLQEWKDLQHG